MCKYQPAPAARLAVAQYQPCGCEVRLRCRLEKCQFAKPCVEYLGHMLSSTGIAKGQKVDAVIHHGNADALSRLPCESDPKFDEEEDDEDTDTVCMHGERNQSTTESNDFTAHHQGNQARPSILKSNTLYQGRFALQCLQSKVLDLLHVSHVYNWLALPSIARELTPPLCQPEVLRVCRSSEFAAYKPPVHPWTVPEKPWTRVHVDHAVNFLGFNWFIVVDAY
ncbi:hypothetical protein CAPTEDRAFT_213520 [Capitella teleta]|uniref:Uncharacterized protein n=1 Tax=Capitella teleta TaxID=283909 RepID=R7VCQ0_CAPTE|nr:hypothetical protein CAPTEDRAFT_213520 [Capitella teleta]|eukprot:ELU14081.1 hypothetical protein CAPTEDRAFT_213520 [Capitella teleta]